MRGLQETFIGIGCLGVKPKGALDEIGIFVLVKGIISRAKTLVETEEGHSLDWVILFLPSVHVLDFTRLIDNTVEAARLFG